MAKITICFILDNGAYREIPYSEIFFEKKRNPQYAGRYFLPFHGYLMEVPFEDYKKEEQDKDRRKYLHKQARENGEISYNSLNG